MPVEKKQIKDKEDKKDKKFSFKPKKKSKTIKIL